MRRKAVGRNNFLTICLFKQMQLINIQFSRLCQSNSQTTALATDKASNRIQDTSARISMSQWHGTAVSCRHAKETMLHRPETFFAATPDGSAADKACELRWSIFLSCRPSTVELSYKYYYCIVVYLTMVSGFSPEVTMGGRLQLVALSTLRDVGQW